jgi:cytochrome c
MSGATNSPGSWLPRTVSAVACAAACLAAAADAASPAAARGAEAYAARCGGCHSVESDRVGPRHAGVFGRRAGSVAGFDYSAALRSSQVVWDAKSLDRWLTDPESLVPGQRMGYSLGDAALRADVIAYLATLTSN